MQVALWVISLLYALEVLRRWRAWKQLPEEKGLQIGTASATVSVVVAMRNEETGLRQFLAGLEAQTYPAELTEIILIDDHSTDDSLAVAAAVIQELQFGHVTLINLAETAHAHGKKAALAAGIARAKCTYILTTDADCFHNPDWISAMVNFAVAKEAQLVSGPVAYVPGESLLSKLQVVEFAGLIGVGAASIAIRSPNMCNGANLLFSKKAYLAVNGYSGNETLASGDDEFLLHKIAAAFPDGYHFLKAKKAIVATVPSGSVIQLLNQRLRWASKAKHYTSGGPRWLAFLVAAMQATVLMGVLFAIIGCVSWLNVLLLICFKFAIELMFFGSVLSFFGRRHLLWVVALLQVVYPPFVLVIAVASLRGTYTWKGRSEIK